MQAPRLEKNLRELELRTDYLTKLASNGQENPRVWEDMRRLASTLLSAEEAQGQEQGQEQTQKQAQEQGQEQETEPQEKTAVFEANSALAEEILNKLGATSSKITQLKEAGRKFNASRAQADLHKVAVQVEEILTQANLGLPWVGSALKHLATEAERLHGLFAPVKI